MRAMRFRFLAALACAAVVAFMASAGCNDSNAVTSPGPMATGANVAGTWAGDYQSDNPALCTSTDATATLTQAGTRVTGFFRASGCGVAGSFTGSVDGAYLTGKVVMAGCTGGFVSGKMTDAGLQVDVSAFTKPLVTGDREVYPGGSVTLIRR